MKRAVVTGATGFVGNALVAELVRHNVKVWAVVRECSLRHISAERRTILHSANVKIVYAELENIVAILEMIHEKIDVFYQLAWDGLLGEALIDYNRQIDNIKYVMDALCVAKKLGCKKFIGAGSIVQYELLVPSQCAGRGDKHCVYKIAKHTCQLMGQEMAKRLGIEFIWPIITNIYGPGEESPRMINTTIRNLLRYGEQDFSEGNQIYDYIYIDDAVRAFYLLGGCGKKERTYVIGSGDARPLKEFLLMIPKLLDKTVKLNFGKMSFNGYYLEPEYYDISELQEDTGFEPQYSFEKGLRKTIEWIRCQEEIDEK